MYYDDDEWVIGLLAGIGAFMLILMMVILSLPEDKPDNPVEKCRAEYGEYVYCIDKDAIEEAE